MLKKNHISLASQGTSDSFNLSHSGHDLIMEFVGFIKVVYIIETQFLSQELYSGYKAEVHEISKNLEARVMTWIKLHTENPKLLDATVQNLVAMETCRPLIR